MAFQLEGLQHCPPVVVELHESDLDHPHGEEIRGLVAIGDDLALFNADVFVKFLIPNRLPAMLLEAIQDDLPHFRR